MRQLRDAADGLQQDVGHKPFRVLRVGEKDAWRLGSVCATACKKELDPYADPYADLIPSWHSLLSEQDSRHSNVITSFAVRAAATVQGYLQDC